MKTKDFKLQALRINTYKKTGGEGSEIFGVPFWEFLRNKLGCRRSIDWVLQANNLRPFVLSRFDLR